MAFTKTGTEVLLRYANAGSGTQPQCRHGTLPLLVGRASLMSRLLPRGLSGFLFCLLGLWLLLCWLVGLLLLLRCGLGLLLWLCCLVCLLLLLRRWLGLLLLLCCWLGLLRWLGLLCRLGLLLLLCRLSLLLRLLREGRNNGSERQEQDCCSESRKRFHWYFPQLTE